MNLFYSDIDLHLKELNEINIELLLCVVCLSSYNLFSAFDKKKLISLAEIYLKDFFALKLMTLNDQLKTYIIDMSSSGEFIELKGISGLTQKMVQIRKDKIYPLIYRLFTLILLQWKECFLL